MKIMSYILTALALLTIIGGAINSNSYRAESAVQEAAISLKMTNVLIMALIFMAGAILSALRASSSQRTAEHEEMLLHVASLRNKTTGDSLGNAKRAQEAEIAAHAKKMN